MNVWFGQTQAPDFPQGAAVTIGNFDGVHLGHRHILQRLKEEAQSRGLPAEVLARFPDEQRLRMPMRPQCRSLNLSNAVAVVVYEAWRQLDFAGS